MRLVVGLGNPGKCYAETRHNLGFRLLDLMAEQQGAVFSPVHPLYKACRIRISDEDVILIKPMTYMNRSGIAVFLAMHHYAVTADDLVIVYDEMALKLGQIRLRPGGQAAGHNGVASVHAAVRSDRVSRLRLGMGPKNGDVVDFVLSPFAEDEAPRVSRMVECGVKALTFSIAHGFEKAMSEFNKHNPCSF